MIEDWGSDRVADLAALTAAALPTERLTPTELSVCLWDDPGPAVVLGDQRGVTTSRRRYPTVSRTTRVFQTRIKRGI